MTTNFSTHSLAIRYFISHLANCGLQFCKLFVICLLLTGKLGIQKLYKSKTPHQSIKKTDGEIEVQGAMRFCDLNQYENEISSKTTQFHTIFVKFYRTSKLTSLYIAHTIGGTEQSM